MTSDSLLGHVVAGVTDAEAPPTEGNWSSFTRAFFVVITIGLLAVAAFNYVVNPMDYYPPRIVPPAVWDARAIKTRLLGEMQPKPRALILGSSRAMKIDP